MKVIFKVISIKRRGALMRYFWSMFWFAILANVTVYVAGSMTGKEVANLEPETTSHH
ncbi:MAG: hypothetical protein K0R18_781 [Bacillales bacterium]|nr:hypothetical protein [Bacillales bacterium]